MRPDARIVSRRVPVSREGSELRAARGASCSWTWGGYAVGRKVRGLGDLGDAGAAQAADDAVNAEGGPHVLFVDKVKSDFAGHEPDGRFGWQNPERWIHEFDSVQPKEW